MNIKNDDIHVKVSKIEKLKLIENANKLDLNLTQLIRVLTLISPQDILKIHNKDIIVVNNKTEIQKLNIKINKIGVNINQCAKAINTLKRYYTQTKGNIDKNMQDVFNNITENALLELYKNIEQFKAEIAKAEDSLIIKKNAR